MHESHHQTRGWEKGVRRMNESQKQQYLISGIEIEIRELCGKIYCNRIGKEGMSGKLDKLLELIEHDREAAKE